jgi:phage shock protein E
LRAFILGVFLTSVVLGCGQKEAGKKHTPLTDQTLVIDVRTDREFKSGHIKGAINIPYDEIGARIRAVADDKNRHIVLYCRSGRRSGIALKTLGEKGYSRVENAGGFEELRKRIKE